MKSVAREMVPAATLALSLLPLVDPPLLVPFPLFPLFTLLPLLPDVVFPP